MWPFSGPVDGYALSAAVSLVVAFPTALAVDRSVPRWLVHGAWGLSPVAAASLLLERGSTAAIVACPAVLLAVAYLVHAGIRFINAPRYDSPAPWAEAASAVGPMVAAFALVSSRFDGTFAGFGEPLATLTVVHFHFTFGLLPMALAAAVRGGRVTAAPVWGVVFAPVVVGLFFALRASPAQPSMGEAAAVVALAAFVVRTAILLRAPPLVRAAAFLLAAATSLAAWFTARLAFGLPTLSYDEMLRWHGVANAVATITLGLWARAELGFEGARAVEPRPDLDAPTRDIAPERALFRDHRPFDLGEDQPGRFDTMADALLGYHFYPSHVMRHATTFEGRPARVGDRIGMTLLVGLFPGYAPIALPATTEVVRAERTETSVALGYLTTRSHYGKGAWCATLTREEGRLRLTIDSRMTPTHPLALLGLPLYRWYQKRAHRLGAEHLGSM